MASAPHAEDDANHPFHRDRRLLGRLLGEVIREQAGEATLARIEAIRQTAVRFRRAEYASGATHDAGAVKAEIAVSSVNATDGIKIDQDFAFRVSDFEWPGAKAAR